MKSISKALSFFFVFLLLFAMASGAPAEVIQPAAVTLSIPDVTADGTAGAASTVNITVDDPSQIAGAAFTVLYDTQELTLTDVQSTFFDTFAHQFATVAPDAPTSVDIGTETYTQPLVKGVEGPISQMGEGTMIAAARVQAGETANNTLFNLTFDVSQAYNGIYPIQIVPSVINNTAAGYSEFGEPIPMLVGALDPTTPLEYAFPEIWVNMPTDSPITGYLKVTGSTISDSVTLDINQPYNFDVESYVDAAIGAEWHVWFHTDTKILDVNQATINFEGFFTDFAAWYAAKGTAYLPDHTNITATSSTLTGTAEDIGKVFSVKVGEGIYFLALITGYTENGGIIFNLLPLGDWNWGREQQSPGQGCGGDYSISGTIYETDGVTPIAGIWLDIFSDTEYCGARVMTDATGNFTAEGLIAGSYRISYYPPPPEYQIPGEAVYQPAYYVDNGVTNTTPDYYNAGLVAITGASISGITMQLSQGFGITGRIYADAQNTPINFPVWVEAWSESTWSWGGVVSTDGTFTIMGLSEASDYRLTVMPYYDPMSGTPTGDQFMPIYWTAGGGTLSWDKSEFVASEAPPVTERNFIFTEGASISGRVTSDGYTGMANIWVNAWSDTAFVGSGAFTDAQGYYTIKGLQEGITDYIVSVYDPNYLYQEQINIADGATGVNFIMSTGATITGTVSGDQGPMAGIWVEAWSPSTGAWGGALSGENRDYTPNTTGTYYITGLPPANDYVVYVSPAGFQPQYWQNASSLETATPIELTANVNGIDFVLSSGNYIAGRVTDSVTGLPVTGIWIEAYSDTTYNWGNAQTDGNGEYKITGLNPASDYRVSYWPDPMSTLPYTQTFYGGTSWDTATLVDISGGSQTGIDLALSEGGKITGTVTTDGSTGVRNVWVDAWSETGLWGGASTKIDGTYEIKGLTAGADYTVTVYPPNKAPITYGSPVTPAPTATDVDFDFSALTGRTIKGNVSDSNSDPIVGAWVNVWSPSTGSWGEARTDALGNFTITGLAQASDFEVYIWSSEYGEFTKTGVTSGDGTTAIDPVVYSAGATISGTITGISEEGWYLWVDAWSESTYSWGGVQAVWNSVDGYTYQIKGLKSDVTDYIVSVWGYNEADGTNIMTLFYTAEGGTTNWSEAVKISLTGGNRDDINFTVDMGHSISGTVTLEGVTAPNPLLTGIWVDAWSDTTYSWGGAVTDVNGAYKITGLAEATDYRVTAGKEGYIPVFYNSTASTPSWDKATLVDVSAGDVTGVNLTLSKGGSITGTVTDVAGKALSNVWIDVWSPTLGYGSGAMTDVQGRYAVKQLIKGTTDYQVTAYPNSGDYRPVTQNNKKPGDVVNFTLGSGFTFYGKVLKPDASAYTGGGGVDLWNAGTYKWTELKTDGTFSISGLAAGDYQIMIWPNDPTYQTIEDTLTLNSGNTSQTAQAFTLDDGVSISGTVKDASGNGIANIWVDAWSQLSGSYGAAVTGSGGSYTITGLSSGSDYEVSVWPQGSYFGETRTVSNVTDDVTGINFTLSSGGSISGTVKYNGIPQANVLVYAWSLTAQSGGTGVTTTNGAYTIDGLAQKTSGGVTASDYVVTVYPPVSLGLAEFSKSGKSVGNTVDFELSAGQTITGYIKSTGDSPLANAKVKLFRAGSANNGDWVNNFFTGADGKFEIKGLASGNYNIQVEMTGYATAWYVDDSGNNATAENNRSLAGTVQPGTEITVKLTAQ
ncbi:MAG: carboxypeptidase-like regulatory domain-containing protein [Syntrophales bacterium]|jgi:protocatechuate 3,4-dioxygenase beta subunit|nr:carboxypeptidase-like regulatory domain-containing protein [Syntrophales bacterium]